MARCGFVALLLTTAIAGAAHADRADSVAVVGVQLTGDGAPELRVHLERSVERGLARAGMDVVPREAIAAALQARPDLAGCTSTACLVSLTEIVGASYFVRGQVDAAGTSYTMSLDLLAGAVDGGVVGSSTGDCPVCTIIEVNQALEKRAAELGRARHRQLVSVVIVSEPAGAQLRVDRRDLGPGPVRLQLAPGDHVIEATQPGFAPGRRAVHISAEAANRVEQVRLVLIPHPTVRASSGKPRRSLRLWKWTAAGATAAALVTGVILVGLDGDNACTPKGDQRQCQNVYDTGTAGLASIAAGTALGATTAWLFYADRPRAARTHIDVTVAGRGAYGSLWFGF
jgi:hypothetical protein